MGWWCWRLRTYPEFLQALVDLFVFVIIDLLYQRRTCRHFLVHGSADFHQRFGLPVVLLLPRAFHFGRRGPGRKTDVGALYLHCLRAVDQSVFVDLVDVVNFVNLAGITDLDNFDKLVDLVTFFISFTSSTSSTSWTSSTSSTPSTALTSSSSKSSKLLNSLTLVFDLVDKVDQFDRVDQVDRVN